VATCVLKCVLWLQVYWNVYCGYMCTVMKCPTEAFFIIINHLIPHKKLQIFQLFQNILFISPNLHIKFLCIKGNYLFVVKPFLLRNLTFRLRTLQWIMTVVGVTSLFQLEVPHSNPVPSSRYSQNDSFTNSNQLILYSETCGTHYRNHSIRWVTAVHWAAVALSNIEYDKIHIKQHNSW